MRDTVHPAGEEDFYERNHMAGAIRAAGLVYISGMLGFRAGELPTDPEEQFTAAFDNVGAALTAAGLGFADVIDIHTFHVGLREHLATFARVNTATSRRPGRPGPPSAPPNSPARRLWSRSRWWPLPDDQTRGSGCEAAEGRPSQRIRSRGPLSIFVIAEVVSAFLGRHRVADGPPRKGLTDGAGDRVRRQ